MRSKIFLFILLSFAQDGWSSHLQISKEPWTPLYQGVDYKLSESKNIEGACLRIHAIRVNIANPDIAFVATPKEVDLKKTTAGEFLREFDVQVAVNGPDEETVKMPPLLDVLSLLREIDVPAGNEHPYSLLNNGEPIAEMDKDERVARSAVGLSADQKTLYFVIVEGGPKTGFWYKDIISMGVTAAELAQIMKNLGAKSAVYTAQNRYPILAVKDSDDKTHTLNLHIDDREEFPSRTHFGIKAKALETSTSGLLDKLNTNLQDLSKFRERIRKNGLAEPVHFERQAEEFDPLYVGSQIRLSALKRTDRKFTGEAKGGVYRDKNEVVWFVKAGFQPTSEYIGARLLHRFLYEQTPMVKLIPNEDLLTPNLQSNSRKFLIASRQVKGFEPVRLWKPDANQFIRRAKLKVFMDWIGLGDRSENNQGHIQIDGGAYAIPARIDFDNSFDDTNGWFDWNDPNDILKQFSKLNKLDGNEKYSLSIENYSLAEMASAIEELSAVSDEEITEIVHRSCKEIEYAYGENPCRGQFGKLAEILIARKNAAKNFDTGYQYLLRDEENKKVHFVKIDPTKKSIQIVPTNSLDPETTSQIAKRVGARAAINGGFFNYGPFDLLKDMGKSSLVKLPKSMVLSVGLIEDFVKAQFDCETEDCIVKFTKFLSKHIGVHAYPAFPDSSLIIDDNRVSCVSALSLGWTRDGVIYKFGELDFNEYSMNHCFSPNMTGDEREAERAGWAAMNYAIGIKTVLLNEGVAPENLNNLVAYDVKPGVEIPRTGICISKNLDWNFVVAESMTLQQFANAMEKHNCYFGGLLDGGGSSSIVHEGKLIFGGNNENSIRNEEDRYEGLKARIAFGTARQARWLLKEGDERPVSDAIVVLDRK